MERKGSSLPPLRARDVHARLRVALVPLAAEMPGAGNSLELRWLDRVEAGEQDTLLES